ncbi:MAG: mechanosensitive ion channel family protein [Clostridia bacterium]|nr:mechanosensitive ion channel family protein [Clostridia bacterium]
MDWNAILTNFVDSCISIAGRLLLSALVLLIGVILIKLLLKFFPNGKKFTKMDDTVRIFLYNFIKIALYAVLIVIIVSIMGVPMASVITVFATAGAAIALAVQGSLANLMGGIMLLIFRPIKVGEVIKVEGESGTVTEVGFFYTQITTFDNVHVSIPNGTMTTSVITNYSREDIRRAEISIKVAHGTDVDLVKKVVDYIVSKNEKILSDPAHFVRVTGVSDSGMEITVRAWCKADDWAGVRCDLYEDCKKAFTNAGIELPSSKVSVQAVKPQ